MKNGLTTYWNPPGGIFPPSVSYADVTNPAIPGCGQLSAHPCAGSRLFFIPVNQRNLSLRAKRRVSGTFTLCKKKNRKCLK